MKLSLFNFTFLIIGKKKKRFWSEACQPVTDRDTLVVSRVGMKDTVPTFFLPLSRIPIAKKQSVGAPNRA